MNIITVLLLVLIIAAVGVATFALLRSRQRSGSVLAAPDPAAPSDRPGGKK